MSNHTFTVNSQPRVQTVRVRAFAGGLGFGGALCLLLLALKLTGVAPQISWAWVVAAPFIPAAVGITAALSIMFVLLLGALVTGAIAAFLDRRK